jgi:hypothetical protein
MEQSQRLPIPATTMNNVQKNIEIHAKKSLLWRRDCIVRKLKHHRDSA